MSKRMVTVNVSTADAVRMVESLMGFPSAKGGGEKGIGRQVHDSKWSIALNAARLCSIFRGSLFARLDSQIITPLLMSLFLIL